MPVEAQQPGHRGGVRCQGGGIEQGFDAAQHAPEVDARGGPVNRAP
jgi:hypothetical protein